MVKQESIDDDDDVTVSDSSRAGGSQSGSGHSESEKVLPPSAKRKKKVVKRTADTKGRYTAPVPASKKGPSPQWVPILMFALWGIGLALIILNYMGVLPGSEGSGSGWYLLAGLGSILAGIVAATQYR